MENANWNSPGLEYIQEFWLKRFSCLHKAIADILNNELQSASIPEWMIERHPVLIQKDPTKVNAVGNYGPIAYLNLIWKLLTDIMTNTLNEHLEYHDLFSKEQNDCRRRSRGTKDQVLIDKEVTKNSKRRKTNLNIAWIDFRKAYNMVPHSWMIKSIVIVGAAENIVNLLIENMKN